MANPPTAGGSFSTQSAATSAEVVLPRVWQSWPLWRNLTLFWTAHSLVFAQTTLSLTGGGPTPENFTVALVQTLATWMPWVPFCVFLIWLVQRFPIDRRRLLSSSAMLCLGCAGVVVAKAIYVFAFNGLIGWYPQQPTLGRVLIASLFNNLLQYWLIVGAAHALIYAARYRQRENEVVALRASLSEARLQALSAQLNPHFLFNTLNTIAEMVHHDAAAADRMLVGLSALLRRSLDGTAEQEVPLREEIAMLEQYLDIQRVRFGARLQTAFALERECLDAKVPLLLLQPLVENAIVHAIARAIGGGRVSVAARRRADRLELTIEDSGGADGGRKAGSGVGLRNTEERLRCLYGAACALQLERTQAGGTRVTLSLPFVQLPDAGGAAA